MCHFSGMTRSVAMYRNVSVYSALVIVLAQYQPGFRTSTVSSTLITPGCRNVRSFLSAFRARGRRALLAFMSNENILQFEPSSYSSSVITSTSAGGFVHVSGHSEAAKSPPRCPGGHQMNMGNWEFQKILRTQRRS